MRPSAALLASAFIVVTLAIQVAAALGYRYKRMWPFICYPMYSAPRFHGQAVPQYRLEGVKLDGKEIALTPEEMNLGFYFHLKGPVTALRSGRQKDLQKYLDSYRRQTGVMLKKVRLYNTPYLIDGRKARMLDEIFVREVDVEYGS